MLVLPAVPALLDRVIWNISVWLGHSSAEFICTNRLCIGGHLSCWRGALYYRLHTYLCCALRRVLVMPVLLLVASYLLSSPGLMCPLLCRLLDHRSVVPLCIRCWLLGRRYASQARGRRRWFDWDYIRNTSGINSSDYLIMCDVESIVHNDLTAFNTSFVLDLSAISSDAFLNVGGWST